MITLTFSQKNICVLVLSFLVVFSLSVVETDGRGAPNLVVAEGDQIELGKATEGEIRKGHFTLINDGDSELKIQNFIITCSCLKILNRNPGKLKPGESVKVNFLFDTAHFGGKETRKDVIIFSNSPESPDKLSISIKVKKKNSYQFLSEGFEEKLDTLVDIRPEKKYNQGHIIGAINVPESEFKSFLEKVPSNIPLLIYSQNGDSSERLAKELSKTVHENLKSLIGGYEQWKLVHPDLVISKSGSY